MRMKVSSYAEFRKVLLGFSDGKLNLLMIDGRAGIGKTELLNEVMNEGDTFFVLLKGHLTPLAFYRTVYECRHMPIVIDDIDTLLRNKDMVKLLKCLCDTTDEKTIEWVSSTSKLEEYAIPSRFSTRSKVCIILNCCGKPDKNQRALYDRGAVMSFEPSAVEVHSEAIRQPSQAASWCWNGA